MKIAIAGYGAEGRSNFAYFAGKGDQVVIVDEHEVEDVPLDASVITGKGAFERLEGYDLVVRTAGLAPRKIKTDGKIWSATNEFFAKCPAPIIGVTGSKGKGTTSSLAASILRAAGKTVHLVGNIGVPALDVVEDISADDIVVYEMSSFQLWDLERSPHVAVVLMIEPDHLDVHVSFEEYVSAKAHIAQFQTPHDYVTYNINNVHSVDIASRSAGQKIPFPDMRFAHIGEGFFWYGDQKLCSVDALTLPGAHNRDNACAAIAATWQWVSDRETIAKGLSAFSGLPHRLKFVREVADVRYYDDSIATTPGSAIAAMKAFSEPKVLIMGGSSKGADFSPVAKVATSQNVKAVIVVGAEAHVIEEAFKHENDIPVINLGSEVSMAQIVARAQQQSDTGDVVVLSPACASFGMFKNYSDRGDQFIDAVNDL
ncbi:MAG TPA: UDP-N-acetylmuramoyl-L-alanine--D-glutamate ligase [Candidatus Saccharimonadales bacterium]|nr:UDP-N-acetylmuramoyl-L-alanine--D-glutamate ligase [Candidatus Saccharimonadales bacterium]